jgi:hypothetical protein
MAPLMVTSAIAAGAAKAPATAKAIRLFFMRSPFLISFKPVRRVNSPPLRKRNCAPHDLTSPGKEEVVAILPKCNSREQAFSPEMIWYLRQVVAYLQHRGAQK